MLKKLIRILNNHFGWVGLTLIVVLIAFLNYQPYTWLSGWDNLHPEFNFLLNIKRSVYAAWQEYQGLGLLGGMGHASDLPRQIFLWLISLIVPTRFLRYFYHFLMLFLGPLGVYFLLKNIILKNYEKVEKEKASLIGAIFYLFNLATLQMFYVPFEPVSTHFAFLPWLFLANLNFLNKGNKGSFIFLLLVNFFSIPQGYVATYFLVYILSLTIVFFFYFLQNRQTLKKILVAYLIVFCLNAFWLLPNLYFVATNVDINLSAKINQMATENNILKNKKYGDLANVAILKGFWFDNVEVDETGEMNYQMGGWVSHLENLPILTIGYLIFLLGLGGILFAFRKRTKRALVFFPVLLVSFIFLANDTPIFSFVVNLFYKIPLFYQIFRFPFTKFALLTAFCLSIFYSLAYLFLSTLAKKSFFQIGILVIFVLLPIIFLYPVFTGNLFYFKNQATIPNEYFQVIDFFNHQEKNTRIANFPQPTFWGWIFYRWNYSGSGFLWYGIEQPILDRAFDPWSDKNENYYWEISYALYSQNLELFEKVLEKYQINWLLVDGNVINPTSPKALYFDELEEMLAASEKIALAQQFGKIKIYQVNLENPVKDFVFLAKNLPIIGPEYNWNNYDVAFLQSDNYVSSLTTHNSQLTTQIYFPFRSLFTGRNQADLEFEIEEKEFHYLFRQTIPEELEGYHLEIPKTTNEELIWVDPNDLSRIRYLTPEVRFDGRVVEVIVPKVGGYYSAQIDPASDPDIQTAKNCDQSSQGVVKNEIVEEGEDKFLRLTAVDANNCSASFWLPNLSHKFSYLIAAESQYREGKSLLFWLENLNARRPDIETYLPKSNSEVSYFIQPPMEEDGVGYTLHFDNISIGREKTVSDLGRATVNLIPFEFLTSLKLVSPQQADANQEPIITPPIKVSHPNPNFYRIEGNFAPNQLLVLSQSFHPGWQAFLVNGRTIQRIKPHVLVNNWANGWTLDQSSVINHQSSVIFVFLPQLLEYFGLFILLVFGCSTAYFLLKYH